MISHIGESVIGRREPLRAAVWLVRVGQSVDRVLFDALELEGVSYTVVLDAPSSWPMEVSPRADIILLDVTGSGADEAERAVGKWKISKVPTLAILDERMVSDVDALDEADDVIVSPWKHGELLLRMRRLLQPRAPVGAPGVITSGDLVVDTMRYDVYVSGRLVVLTFKEYELLKLMVSNVGHVFSREALLEQVWGYQYFGGTRTVDVHIRRLRSKIEDATHTFIDTVWNVGYRFRG